MRDQREGDRRVLHVFAQARRDGGKRIAAWLPPCPPDPVGDGVEKRRASAQVRNGEGQGHRLFRAPRGQQLRSYSNRRPRRGSDSAPIGKGSGTLLPSWVNLS